MDWRHKGASAEMFAGTSGYGRNCKWAARGEVHLAMSRKVQVRDGRIIKRSTEEPTGWRVSFKHLPELGSMMSMHRRISKVKTPLPLASPPWPTQIMKGLKSLLLGMRRGKTQDGAGGGEKPTIPSFAAAHNWPRTELEMGNSHSFEWNLRFDYHTGLDISIID